MSTPSSGSVNSGSSHHRSWGGGNVFITFHSGAPVSIFFTKYSLLNSLKILITRRLDRRSMASLINMPHLEFVDLQ